MEKLEAAVIAFGEAEAAISNEVEATLAARDHLRRMNAQGLLDHAARREGFNAAIAVLVGKANQLMKDLCQAAGGQGDRLEDLYAVAPQLASRLTEPVARARAAARALAEVDAFDREVSTRALALVRSASGRLPTAGAVYGRSGAPKQAVPRPTTSSSV